MSSFESLRIEYKSAFEQWALHVNRLRAISQSAPGNLAIAQAQEQAAAAETVYRSIRHTLVQKMLAGSHRQ